MHHTRLYQGLDQLLEHKTELQLHLKERLGTLFSLDYDLLLYDVTSTYFEGECQANPMARHGYSRDGRPDCRQVCIGLVVSKDGYPLGYEVFDGNTIDVTTVQEIVTTIEQRYGKSGRVWVMDRGMTSEENLEWLRQEGRRYLLGTPRSEMKRWAQELRSEQGWKHVRSGLEVKQCQGPDGTETFLLCRSQERQAKEQAMHERATKRIRTELGSLGRRLKRAKRAVEKGSVERQVGRILERHLRAAKRFDIEVKLDPSRASEVRLTWKERKDWRVWTALTEGTYILRTNVNDWSDEELWKTYVQLWQAEAAFRIHKSDLSIAGLAPARRTGAGPHPGVLPGLLPVEGARGLAEPGRPGQQPTNPARGAQAPAVRRRRPARRRWTQAEAALRRPARRRARQSHRASRAAAPQAPPPTAPLTGMC